MGFSAEWPQGRSGIVRFLVPMILSVLAVTMSPALAGNALAEEQDLFSEDLFDGDLFGGDDLIIEVEDAQGTALEKGLLTGDGIDVGGSYRFSLESSLSWSDSSASAAPTDRLNGNLTGSLYADARPSGDFRVFGKAEFSYLADEYRASQSSFRVTELFSDFNLNDKLFFRVGKQTINWGVGYFFSPADIINIGRIDPEDPEAQREGPVALKLNVPFGSNNLYMYGIADSVSGVRELALAPKAEYVIEGTELGVGAYYRTDRAPRMMLTVSSAVGKVSVFGEGVVSYGSDKSFVVETPLSPENPFGLSVLRREDQYFAHATVGVNYSYVAELDDRFNISGAAQYLYNGEGYDGGFLRENAIGVGTLLSGGRLSPTDLIYSGRHYAAASLNWAKVLGSDFSAGLFWLGNMSDGSGKVTASAGSELWENLRASIGLSRRSYGDLGSEYSPTSPMTTLSVGITFSGEF